MIVPADDTALAVANSPAHHPHFEHTTSSTIRVMKKNCEDVLEDYGLAHPLGVPSSAWLWGQP